VTGIYLDYNASTPIDPEVAEAMRPPLVESFGNPSSNHWASRSAKDKLETAQAAVAALLGCEADEIVFTSGGSEANNLALTGLFYPRGDRPRTLSRRKSNAHQSSSPAGSLKGLVLASPIFPSTLMASPIPMMSARRLAAIPFSLERFPRGLNRLGFPNRRKSDS
jgi:hypothetical protein